MMHRIKRIIVALAVMILTTMGGSWGFGDSDPVKVDGNITEWDSVPEFAVQKDSSGASTQILKIIHSSSMIYFSITGKDIGPNLQIFIDSDCNASTGYREPLWTNAGFDLMIKRYLDNTNTEQLKLLKYNGTRWDAVNAPNDYSLMLHGTDALEGRIAASLMNHANPSIRIAPVCYNPISGAVKWRVPYSDTLARYLYNPTIKVSGNSAQSMLQTPITEDFESPLNLDPLGPLTWFSEFKSPSFTPVGWTAPNGPIANTGLKYARVILNKSDPLIYGGSRSEISSGATQMFNTYVYEFSTFLPANGEDIFKDDTDGKIFGSEILAQWHSIPDQQYPKTAPPTYQDSLSTFPVLALRTAARYQDKSITAEKCYALERNWSSSEITPSSTGYQARDSVILKRPGTNTPITYTSDRGKWVNWRFTVRWDWRNSVNYGNGLTKVERTFTDDKGVVSGYQEVFRAENAPNTYNDDFAPFFKLGIYKYWGTATTPGSILTKRILYYDSIRIRKP